MYVASNKDDDKLLYGICEKGVSVTYNKWKYRLRVEWTQSCTRHSDSCS